MDPWAGFDALTPPVFEHPFASALLALSRFPRESLNVILERASVDRMLPPSLCNAQLVDASSWIGSLVVANHLTQTCVPLHPMRCDTQ
jgi:hypothetical protein